MQTLVQAVSALVEEVRQQGMDGVAFDALVARPRPKSSKLVTSERHGKDMGKTWERVNFFSSLENGCKKGELRTPSASNC